MDVSQGRIKMNYEQCVEYILNIPKFNKIKSNEKCCKILKELGNPQEKFKVFHVAGTNGKGSTCAFLNSILLAAEKRTGLFTSPHLVKINERIKINGEDISDSQFLMSFLKVQKVVEDLYKGEYIPTFFEYLFLISVVAFEENNIEYVVFETGMGGRLDATNIIEKPVASIITTVSMDHMEILGDTLEKIACEKAGIIKKDVPVYYFGDNAIVKSVIENKAREAGAVSKAVMTKDITIFGKKNKVIDFSISSMYDRYGVLSVPFVTEYQTVNAALAVTALLGEASLKLTEKQLKQGLMATIWPGRMEEVRKDIYLDGAHNREGIEQFVKYVNEISKRHSVYILFSVVKEKEYYLMMDLISEIKNCRGYLVAPVKSARAVVADDMADYLKKNVAAPVYKFEDLTEAINYALSLKAEEDVLFCTGSLYMVGEIKQALNNRI